MHKPKQMKLKTGLWAFYAIRTGNRSCLFYSSRRPAMTMFTHSNCTAFNYTQLCESTQCFIQTSVQRRCAVTATDSIEITIENSNTNAKPTSTHGRRTGPAICLWIIPSINTLPNINDMLQHRMFNIKLTSNQFSPHFTRK